MDKEVEVREVIVTTLTKRGNGVTTPIRKVIQIWEKDGTLIAENDGGSYSEAQMEDFGHWCALKRQNLKSIGEMTVHTWKKESETGKKEKHD